MQTARATSLKLQVAPSYEAMSRQAVAVICRELRKQPNLLLCVSAGATPTRAYQLLAAQRASEPKLFTRLRLLQIDEWFGLAPGSLVSCAADLWRKVAEPLGVPREHFQRFNTNARDPHAECARVRRWLKANGPIDVCILGLGVNGHVAMNEPAGALLPYAHVAVLSRSSRNHAMLQGLAKKPRFGMTLGMADILRSRRILLLVNGSRKRATLKRLMTQQLTTRFPASLLCLHPNATVFCDQEAAGDLRFR